MPDIELGINDMWRQGKEVVGRHDIIPVVTEEWIRLENVEFHSCVQQDEYEKSRIIKYVVGAILYRNAMRTFPRTHASTNRSNYRDERANGHVLSLPKKITIRFDSP